PVFETTLGSIDLNKLNKTPKATDQMSYDINVNGDANNNKDTNGVGVAEAVVPTATKPLHNNNLVKLVDFQDATGATDDPYTGSPDFSTNKNVYDSLGGEHRLTTNFYKRDVVSVANSANDYNGDGVNDKYTSWIVQYTMEDMDTNGDYATSGHVANAAGQLLDNTGAVVATPAPAGTDTLEGQIFELRFDTNGNLVDVLQPNSVNQPAGTNVANSPLPAAGWTSTGKTANLNWVVDSPFTGANDPLGNPNSTNVNINVDFTNMTQFAGSNNLRGVSQNGYQIGDLVGLKTGLDGVIEANYSNGRAVPVAQVALANFTDKNAMTKLGGQTYAESFGSGTVQVGTPNNNGYGKINSGSLEYSNVDTAGELVNMIQTQRTYQASAQVLSTSKTLTQTILNL
ncbi:MAG: flagellar hook-basal body complex protein, partial [Hydrogenovibrio sp.]|nr:flagellar hook-basal body complex protein [Hydrogenovibrio sp.]